MHHPSPCISFTRPGGLTLLRKSCNSFLCVCCECVQSHHVLGIGVLFGLVEVYLGIPGPLADSHNGLASAMRLASLRVSPRTGVPAGTRNARTAVHHCTQLDESILSKVGRCKARVPSLVESTPRQQLYEVTDFMRSPDSGLACRYELRLLRRWSPITRPRTLFAEICRRLCWKIGISEDAFSATECPTIHSDVKSGSLTFGQLVL